MPVIFWKQSRFKLKKETVKQEFLKINRKNVGKNGKQK